jgi:hypothetical protein
MTTGHRPVGRAPELLASGATYRAACPPRYVRREADLPRDLGENGELLSSRLRDFTPYATGIAGQVGGLCSSMGETLGEASMVGRTVRARLMSPKNGFAMRLFLQGP